MYPIFRLVVLARSPAQFHERRVLRGGQRQPYPSRLELTDEAAGWRANIRTSSNEPLLRLNVEARSPATLATQLRTLMVLIEKHGATLAADH
jgi:phosphomannomutase